MSISALELESLRGDLSGYGMPDTCEVQRDAGGAADPYGGRPAPVWATHLTGVPCAYWQTGGRTSIGSREAVIETQRLVLPHGTDVRESDRIVDVRDPAGVLRTTSALRIDAVARREAVVECDVTEVGW